MTVLMLIYQLLEARVITEKGIGSGRVILACYSKSVLGL